ncbi:MAG: hypothetical protein ACI9P5_000988 [Saprospiraceae bacterium]|jgi:hypothetical protein
MNRLISFFAFSLFSICCFSQAQADLDKSVPVWMEYDTIGNQGVLKWINDANASNYYISEASPSLFLTPIATVDGKINEYPLGPLEKGEKYNYHIRKDFGGRGIITFGREVSVVHQRGRCLVAVDDILVDSLAAELSLMMLDLTMDGWEVDTMHINQSEEVYSVKAKVVEWYDSEYEYSQSLYLLGHIPVPYSGNASHDGHGDHQGAWAADVYYGEINGNWTDVSVNNETPSRAVNKNIPGDGKFDQTTIPTNMEIEVGRVDFHNLPAFQEDEIELTRQYLVKSHDFKLGNKEYPRRALVENNFSGFAEGFGQSGWRNFTTMFGGDSVSIKNYEVELESNKYLFSYACGGGSYTSCSGVGSTQNLWAAKDIQSIFTLNFGSYFGDWDSQNNFLRAALASGDVLSNAWAGRPVWHLYDMSLGKHIGYCAKLSQDASGGFFNPGFSAKSAHIALMGDPTLRLHAMKPADNLLIEFTNGDIHLTWNPSPDGSRGHIIYRKKEDLQWEFIAEVTDGNIFVDPCVSSNTEYTYIVKGVRLEQTGSGSYYNTSLGISTSILSGENPNLLTFYADIDMDGFGDLDSTVVSCTQPSGFVDNDLDCDDTNSEINPDGIEILSNDIDEDCDGEDLTVGIADLKQAKIKVFPNPTSGIIGINVENKVQLMYRMYNVRGEVIRSGELEKSIDISDEVDGMYWLEITSLNASTRFSELVQLIK